MNSCSLWKLRKLLTKKVVIWKWFGFRSLKQQQSAKTVCKICRQSAPTKAGNTTNLYRQLKRCSPSDHTVIIRILLKLAALSSWESEIKVAWGGVSQTTEVRKDITKDRPWLKKYSKISISEVLETAKQRLTALAEPFKVCFQLQSNKEITSHPEKRLSDTGRYIEWQSHYPGWKKEHLTFHQEGLLSEYLRQLKTAVNKNGGIMS